MATTSGSASVEPTRAAATCDQPPGAAPRSTTRLPRLQQPEAVVDLDQLVGGARAIAFAAWSARRRDRSAAAPASAATRALRAARRLHAAVQRRDGRSRRPGLLHCGRAPLAAGCAPGRADSRRRASAAPECPRAGRGRRRAGGCTAIRAGSPRRWRSRRARGRRARARCRDCCAAPRSPCRGSSSSSARCRRPPSRARRHSGGRSAAGRDERRRAS